MTTTLIRNGRVITASDDYVADVLLKDGIVHSIGQQLEVGEEVQVVDATGLYVLPGGVDTHVHMENVWAQPSLATRLPVAPRLLRSVVPPPSSTLPCKPPKTRLWVRSRAPNAAPNRK